MSSRNEGTVTSDNASDAVVVDRGDTSNCDADEDLSPDPDLICELQRWLQPIRNDAIDREYRKNLAFHAPGTGAWLISNATYQEWLESDRYGLLWIKGKPGSGKSVTAANLIREIGKANPRPPVLFLLFRQNIDASYKPVILLRDWMSQIVEYSRSLQTRVKEYLEEDEKVDSIPIEDIWKDLRMALIGSSSKVIFVVDALNEMDGEQDGFFQSIASLGTLKPGKVKVLITSRPAPRVEQLLNGVPGLHIVLDGESVDLDISTYVHFRLSNSLIPQSQWQNVADVVVGQANGSFLYANLAMHRLLQPGTDIDDVLAQLPADLNGLYTDVLNVHAQRIGMAADIQRLILQSVTYATRPLRLLELAEIIMVTSSNELTVDLKATKDLIRIACGPLLEILPDETVSVAHHSFTEYLKDVTRIDNAGYPVLYPGPTHARLALSCLRYLQAGCLEEIEILDTKKIGYNTGLFGFSGPTESRPAAHRLKFPLFDYAMNNWHHHVNESERAQHDQSELNKEIGALLGNDHRLKMWLQYLKWLFKSQTEAPRSATQLHVAARAGLVSYAKDILGTMSVDALDSDGKTPLWWAASEGHARVITELIAAGANPSAPVSGPGALHEAASKNHAEAVKVLLAAGVDPLAVTEFASSTGRYGSAHTRSTGVPPLMSACENGHTETVREFLPFLKNIEHIHRALSWAAGSGRFGVVSMLLDHPGVDVNAKVQGETALFRACGSRGLETIKILLQAGADPNIECESTLNLVWRITEPQVPKYTCIHRLCGIPIARELKKNVKATNLQNMFSLLLEAGADIHKRTASGETPLHGAVRDPVLTKALLDAGADANATANDGRAPLHKACKAESISLLIEEGHAEINLRDHDGRTPLLQMVQDDQSEAILKLLQYGPDCRVTDKNGNSALHMALRWGNTGHEVIEGLLAGGSDLSLKDKEGCTPLLVMRSAMHNYMLTVDLLLQRGADIDARDRRRVTLLYGLMSSPHSKESQERIQALTDRGASLKVRDINGRTLLHEAVAHHELSGGSFLRSYDTKVSRFDFMVGLGLDIHAVDYRGNGLLHELALRYENHDSRNGPRLISFWEHLVSMGLDLEQKNYVGRTPLHLLLAPYVRSARHGPGDSNMPVEFIVSRTANINAADDEGITPLHMAVVSNEAMTKKLLDAGANPEAPTNEGLTPLHLACRCRNSNIVGLLLTKLRSSMGINIDDASSRPVTGANAKSTKLPVITPLYYACRSGRPETVALLLAAGADVKLLNHFKACCEFEEEDRLWQSGTLVTRWDGIALKYADTARPIDVQYPTIPDHISVDTTARIGDILDMLISHGADIWDMKTGFGWSDQLLNDLFYKASDYTSTCMLDASTACESETRGNSKIAAATTTALSVLMREGSIKTLRSSNLVRPGFSNSHLLRRFLIRREYHLVEELGRLGAVFLPTAEGNNCNLTVLIQNGFASLTEKLGSVAAEDCLVNGDWHAYGNKSQPGLWFAKRDVSYPPDLYRNPVPFIIQAVQRELPNTEIVRLLVEKFRVDIDEMHWIKDHGADVPTSAIGSALHQVASGNSWWHVHQALPYLLKAGANTELRNDNGQTPLHVALGGPKPVGSSHDGNIGPFHKDAAKMLIEAGADVHAVDDAGQNCLCYGQNDVDMIKLLKQNGLRVTADSLFAAIDAKNVPVLRELLSGDVDANMRRQDKTQAGKSTSQGPRTDNMEPSEVYPLYYASMLLETPQARDPKARNEPLIAMELVQVLLDHGANPFAKFLRKIKPSDIAFPGPMPETPEGYREETLLHDLLDQSKALDTFFRLPDLDTNHRDAYGRTVLHAACQCSKGPDYALSSYTDSRDDPVTVFERLVVLGADLQARDGLGRNALHLMIGEKAGCDYDRFKCSFAELIQRVPDLVNQADSNGKTPLHYAVAQAAFNRDCRAVDKLLSSGADPLVITRNGDTVLHLLAENLETPQLRALFQNFVARGANVNARNARSETPLFPFCHRPISKLDGSLFAKFTQTNQYSEDDAILILQELGADFNATDFKGRGLLHVAAEGKFERFKELMDLGLDPLLADHAQKTPIDVAVACGNQKIVEFYKRLK